MPEVVYALVKGSKQEEAEEIVELANKDEISGSSYVSLPYSSLFGSLLTSLYMFSPLTCLVGDTARAVIKSNNQTIKYRVCVTDVQI